MVGSGDSSVSVIGKSMLCGCLEARARKFWRNLKPLTTKEIHDSVEGVRVGFYRASFGRRGLIDLAVAEAGIIPISRAHTPITQ